MNDSKLQVPESPTTIEETRTFWRTTAQNVVRDALPALENAASQCLTVDAILIGFYMNAVAYLQGRGAGISIVKILSPLSSWFVSVVLALSVFLPKSYAISLQSSTGTKDFIQRILTTKHRRLKLSYLFLLIGISLLLWVVVEFLSKRTP